MKIVRGYQQLPWDDDLIPLDVEDWLFPIVITIDQIQAEKSGNQKEIKLGPGRHA